MSPNRILVLVLSALVIVVCLVWIFYQYTRLNPTPEAGSMLAEPNLFPSETSADTENKTEQDQSDSDFPPPENETENQPS